ncbi:unnamed protein product [Echinostoma caproni]|uniref:EB1 C-terminal domain-containing protein n=1 Tax=Echinostoma caproni TaxID=27848 RepID=A0A183AHJ7_9TREM|nr:unnamed protein product [Echinostoma caproni]
MDRGVQVQIDDTNGEMNSDYQMNQSSFGVDINPEQFEMTKTSSAYPVLDRTDDELVSDQMRMGQSDEIERRKRSLEEVFQEIEPAENSLISKLSFILSQGKCYVFELD